MAIRFSIMTYNVHSCIGSDGKSSPERISEIIALYEADIICLQELDVGLLRSGKEDQAGEIARRLNMDFHFHPSLRVEEGEYGNAVLTRYSSRVVKAGALPTLPGRTVLEQRGALWVSITISGRPVNIITTHLGLSRKERLAQADELLGSAWLRDPECRPPVILCGDLNSVPVIGRVYGRFSAALEDSSRRLPWGRGRTWPSAFPCIRLDHVFCSRDIDVEHILVPWTRLTRKASDHLPLIATLKIG